MKIFRLFALLLLIVPFLAKAADVDSEETASYSESSEDDEVDKMAFDELITLCSEWMTKNNCWNFQTAQLFMATFVTTPGRDYAYIYTNQALNHGANPNTRDKEGKTPLMIAIERQNKIVPKILR